MSFLANLSTMNTVYRNLYFLDLRNIPAFLFLDYSYVELNFASPLRVCSYPQYLLLLLWVRNENLLLGHNTPQRNSSKICSVVLICSNRQHGCLCAITSICTPEFYSDFQECQMLYWVGEMTVMRWLFITQVTKVHMIAVWWLFCLQGSSSISGWFFSSFCYLWKGSCYACPLSL